MAPVIHRNALSLDVE